MRCVCCNKKIKLLNEELPEEDIIFSIEKNRMAENKMWLDGLVGSISGGYGSIHDLSMFVIAICDECLSEKIDTGTVAQISSNLNYTNEVAKKIWRRNNNLEELT